MNSTQFAEQVKTEVERFALQWEESRKADPANFPEEMGPEEWLDHFDVQLEAGGFFV